MNANIKQIKEARKIMLQHTPSPRICRTVDAYPTLTATDRGALIMSDIFGRKFLPERTKK